MSQIEKSKLSLKEKYFYSLNDAQTCKKAMKEAAQGFYFVGGLFVLLAFLPYPAFHGVWLDGLLMLIFALLLHLKQSRVAAVLLLLLTGAELVVTFFNKIGVSSMGGNNIILGIIIFIYSIRGVQAAFKYHKLKN
jgi:hypothetical protein